MIYLQVKYSLRNTFCIVSFSKSFSRNRFSRRPRRRAFSQALLSNHIVKKSKSIHFLVVFQFLGTCRVKFWISFRILPSPFWRIPCTVRSMSESQSLPLGDPSVSMSVSSTGFRAIVNPPLTYSPRSSVIISEGMDLADFTALATALG